MRNGGYHLGNLIVRIATFYKLRSLCLSNEQRYRSLFRLV